MEVKHCNKCRKVLPIEMFGKLSAAPSGINWYCIDCTKAYFSAYRAANRQRENQRQLAWAENNWAKRVVTHAKSRAKHAGIAFNLTWQDIEQPEVCPILGIVLDYRRNGKKNRDDAPSLDRVDPKLGYVKGNVQVISQRANRIKNDATPAELRKLADYMEMLWG